MSALLEEFRGRPIPDYTEILAAKEGYRSHPINEHDSNYRAALVDLRTRGLSGKNYYSHANNPPYRRVIPGSIEELFVRPEILQQLLTANEQLRAGGYQLFITDAWRPQAIQRYFFNEWFPAEVRKIHPEWSKEQVYEETRKYWAVPAANDIEVDPLSPPPHATGAALDLTVITEGGTALSMGSELEEGSERSHMDFLEKNEVDENARANRRMLYWTLTGLGFMGNPTEWWHWSLGDQMWAKLTSYRTGSLVPARYSATHP